MYKVQDLSLEARVYVLQLVQDSMEFSASISAMRVMFDEYGPHFVCMFCV